MKLETIHYFPKVASFLTLSGILHFSPQQCSENDTLSKKFNSMKDYANVIQFGYQKESIFSITSNKNATQQISMFKTSRP